MWQDPRYICRKCNSVLRIERNASASLQTCSRCERVQYLFKCPEKPCKYQRWICFYCLEHDFLSGEEKKNKPLLTTTSVKDDGTPISSLKIIAFSCLIVFVGIFMYFIYKNSQESIEDVNIKILKDLKKDFPSQRHETWCHFLSVLEKGVPTVKSITFLHSEDERTQDCLTKKLVSLYSGNKSIKNEEITFSTAGFEAMDYGFALEHYHLIVEKFRVFVTDLVKVPGKIARIFHSLCDEVSSDIKPSLFIFTLKYDERTKKLKPMERAVTILKETWSDLPENEIYPLLSRVVKNVVDVVPERKINCN